MILKGVLLYATIFTVIMLIAGIDTLYDAGYLIPYIIVCIVLCRTCHKCISKEEFNKLTFKWFDDDSDDLW